MISRDPFRRTNTQEYADTPSLLHDVDYYEIMGSMDQFVWPWFGVRGPEMQAAFRKVQNASNQVAALRSVLLMDGKVFVFSAPVSVRVYSCLSRISRVSS
jgi:hypothetical protein